MGTWYYRMGPATGEIALRLGDARSIAQDVASAPVLLLLDVARLYDDDGQECQTPDRSYGPAFAPGSDVGAMAQYLAPIVFWRNGPVSRLRAAIEYRNPAVALHASGALMDAGDVW